MDQRYRIAENATRCIHDPREGRYQEALEEFRLAIRLKADDPRFQLNYGNAALKSGLRPETEKTLEGLKRLDPKMAQKLEASLKASPGAPEPEDLPALFNRIKPTVVFVEKYDARQKRVSISSGFFINGQGQFITNYHCLRGGAGATVRTSDGKRYPVKLILAEDKFNDLILASIDPPPGGVPYLPVIGALPQVGEEVVNLGNPKGLEWTLSTGIVSAIRGWPTPHRQVVQFTAPTSHGSSGSPIMNRKGQVLAVNAMTLASGQNLSFGVPGKFVLALKPGPGKTMEQRAQAWLASAQDLTRQGEEYLQNMTSERRSKPLKTPSRTVPITPGPTSTWPMPTCWTTTRKTLRRSMPWCRSWMLLWPRTWPNKPLRQGQEPRKRQCRTGSSPGMAGYWWTQL